jgi:hypothetical protein
MRRTALQTFISRANSQGRSLHTALTVFSIAFALANLTTAAFGQGLPPLGQYGHVLPQPPSLGIPYPLLTQLGGMPGNSLRTTSTSLSLTAEQKSKLIAPELERAFALLAPRVKDAFVSFEHPAPGGIAYASGTLIKSPELESWLRHKGLMEEGEVLAVTAGHFAVPGGSDIYATVNDGNVKKKVPGRTIIAAHETSGDDPHLDIALIAINGSDDLKKKALQLAGGSRLKEEDIILGFGAQGPTPASQRVFKVIDPTPREEYKFSDQMCVTESLWAPIFGDDFESVLGNSGMGMVTARGDVIGVMVARSLVKCEKQPDGKIRVSEDATSLLCRTDAILYLLRKKYENSTTTNSTR